MPTKSDTPLLKKIRASQKANDAAERKYQLARQKKETFLNHLFSKMTQKKGAEPSSADVAKAKEIKRSQLAAVRALKKRQAEQARLVDQWTKAAINTKK
jgi:hypothetical protein